MMKADSNTTIDKAIAAVRQTVDRMAASLPAPILVKTATTFQFRYKETGTRQAIVLKSVRVLSAIISLRTLIKAGLPLDAGAIMRILDENGSDIQFLAGPLIFGKPQERNHERFLKEFYQEEFDHPNPLKSSQKRDRVSRRDIRAYVARTYQRMNVSEALSATETVEHAFSGFVHGAMCHTMDAYDGEGFRIPMQPGDDPLEAIADQFSHYAHRALMDAALAAKALGDEDLFAQLYNLQIDLFDEYGEARPQARD